MTGMVERMARAMWPDRWAIQDGLRKDWPDLWASRREADIRDQMLGKARAAIAALATPAEAMIRAGSDVTFEETLDYWTDINVSVTEDAAAEVWKVMIQAALDEGKADAK